MENTMKHLMMLLGLALSPLSFAYGDDTSGDGTNTGSKSSGGGYGSGPEEVQQHFQPLAQLFTT